MLTTSVRRSTILFLLCATLASAWPPSAAGAQRQSIRPTQGEEWAVPEILNRLWSFLIGVEVKDGCRIDPFGRCASKEGCHLDPQGRCTNGTPIQPKEGCGIDPFGRCLP